MKGPTLGTAALEDSVTGLVRACCSPKHSHGSKEKCSESSTEPTTKPADGCSHVGIARESSAGWRAFGFSRMKMSSSSDGRRRRSNFSEPLLKAPAYSCTAHPFPSPLTEALSRLWQERLCRCRPRLHRSTPAPAETSGKGALSGEHKPSASMLPFWKSETFACTSSQDEASQLLGSWISAKLRCTRWSWSCGVSPAREYDTWNRKTAENRQRHTKLGLFAL